MTALTTIWAHLRAMWSYRHEPENVRELADLYWRGLLIFASVLVVLFALYGGYLFWSAIALKEGGSVLLPQGGAGALNRVELQAILDGFSARAMRYESVKNDRPKITDPSR